MSSKKIYISFFLLLISITVFPQKQGAGAVDSLYNKAQEQFNNGNIENAISHINQALSIQEKTIGKEHLDYAKSLQKLVLYKCVLGLIPEATQIGNEILRIREKSLGKKHPDYARALHNMALINAQTQNYTEAIRLEKEAVDIFSKSLGKEHEDYTLALSSLASHYIGIGNILEAKNYTKEILNIQEKRYGKEDTRYLNTLNALIMCNVSLKDHNEALNLSLEALAITEKTYGKEHPNYIRKAMRCSSLYHELGDMPKAVSLNNKALSITENIYGRLSQEYISNLTSLANITEKYSEKIRILNEVLNLEKQLYKDKEPEKLFYTLRNLSHYESRLFNYHKAIDYGKEALFLAKKTFDRNHAYYASILSTLSTYYAELEDFDQAIQMGKEALKIYEKKYGTASGNYTSTLHDLALSYLDFGSPIEALRILQKCVETNKKNDELQEWEPEMIAISLNSLSLCYHLLGNDIKAIHTAEEALEFIKKAKGHIISTVDETLASILSNLAMYYFGLDEYEKAIQLDQEALSIRKKIYGEEHPAYANSLNHLSITYEQAGNYQEAISIGHKALAINEKIYGKEHTSYAGNLYNLARFHWGLCNYEEAIRLTIEANKIYKIKLGKQHPSYQTGIQQLSQILFETKDYKNIIPLTIELFSLRKNLILSSFRRLTSKERKDFWNKNSLFIQYDLPFYSFYIKSDSLLRTTYDAALLNKGLLLNTDIEMRSFILKSEDPSIIKAYDNMRQSQLILEKLYQMPEAERFLNIDSLELVTNQAEEDLISKSKTYGDFTRNINIQWQNIQKKLTSQDIAIEFLQIPILNDSIMYTALLLKPGMISPKMIPLFEKKQLDRIDKKQYYTTPALCQLIWEPLAEDLKGVKNIYFAPAGELHNIAIEYLPSSDSTFIAEQMNFYRLSSTRQLALRKDKCQIKEATLYGGLKYDTDTTTLIAENKKYTDIPRDLGFQYFFHPDSLNLRNGAKYLPATKIEAEEIKQTLEKAKLQPTLYMDIKGTEESFKALSGKHINMLHIATHGFYWTETEAKQIKKFDFLMLGDNNQARYIEDKALTRSGLLMSGANIALQGRALPEGIEDGILTAKELAELDLRGVDLVVLSACQTGLGEIAGDGVFGLQRGFKKAGANTLLMSLWKVDDNATRLLMTQFYKNLFAGKSKFESLRDAQKYVRDYEIEIERTTDKSWESIARQKENKRKEPVSKELKRIKKYASPYYWAAFILLDAI